MKKLLAFILVMMVPAAVAAAGDASQSVFVSILPQKYMVERIGKDKVDVKVMVAPGASPHTYEPKPAQMTALSKSRLYFSIGVPFENFWLDKITAANPKLTIVHTDEGIHKIPMAAHHHGEHDEDAHENGHREPVHHDHDAEHHEEGHEDHHGHDDHGIKPDHGMAPGHAGLDPHIWTSPARVKQQALTICRALSQADPSNKAFYTNNCDEFIREIDDLDKALHALFKDKPGTRFMVFHPSWGYFARDYGLEMIPVEIEGKNPKPAQLMALIRHARELGIRVLFVQPQFSSKSAKLIARELKGQVVAADPLAYDWMDNLKTIAAQFKEALK